MWIEHGVRNPAKNELTDGIRIKDKRPANLADTAPSREKMPSIKLKCADCGKEITGSGSFTAAQIADGSKKKYGRQLCVECGQKAKAAMEAEVHDAQVAAAEKVAEDAQNIPKHDDLAAQLAAAAEE